MTGYRLARGMLVLVAASGVLAATARAADDKEAVGTWSLTYSPGDGEHKATLSVTKFGDDLKGVFKDGDRKFEITKVEFNDGTLVFSTRTERDGQPTTATFEGRVKGDAMEGSADWKFGEMNGSFPFEGKREAEKPKVEAPSVVAVPGKPNLLLGSYDIAPLGYQVDEFFISAKANSYKLADKATNDGKWEAVPAGTAPYTTRIVVVRPSDPAKFSGAVVVEWLNVSGGLDVPVDWNMVHREIVRRGHGYVAVSAQAAGIEGGRGLMGPGVGALKKADPERYGRLKHPGDAYSFDIFSQAGRLVRDAALSKILGPLRPDRVLAIGESQSAFYLTTYATAVDPVAKVYDGILIHSRFGAAAPLDGASMLAAVTGPAKALRMRPDLRVPVLTVVTEGDVLGWPPLGGSYAARQPDGERLRVWEVAGTAHADNYVFTVGFIDSGSLPVEKLAAAFAPTSESLGRKLDQPMNFAPQHHYVVEAALWQLDRWVRTGKPAPSAPPLKLTEDKGPKLVTDANGLAEGGLRTPWVDVPTAVLSGAGGMVGTGKPFDAATLERLYPGGKAEYLKKFEASLDAAIAAGFIVPEDRPEVMGLAAFSFHGMDEPARPEGDQNATQDPLFKEPYVDKDGWRDKPVRHRYVHGGFKGNEARFSFYFPPKDRYQGRFFQHVTAIPISENLGQFMTGEADFVGFSAESGGYFVETNEGGMGMLGAGKDASIAGYRVNAAAARYSRVLAAEMYGPHRTYGYAFGASGGAFRTVAGAENTDVWDGVVPLVIGSPMALPNVFTVRALALRVLKDKFPAIVDAVEPGGGDMYAGLNDEERAVLAEVTRMGFPPRAWFDHKTLGLGALPIFLPMVVEQDPKYFEDFWKVPGYAGADPPESLKRARVQHQTVVKKVMGTRSAEEAGGGADAFRRLLGGEMKVQVEHPPAGDLQGADLVVKTGAAAGKVLPIRQVSGDVVTLGTPTMGVGGADPGVVKSIKAGDEVQVDNSNFLAVQYYHRHQVPAPDYYVWDQFRGPDGKPLYPQRPRLLGPGFAAGTAVAQTGRFHGKMVVVESLMDQDALPWQADWYRSRVADVLGPRLDENFRVWFTDHALHGEMQPRGTHTVGYFGELHQALRDLSAWVEKGVAPPASTTYKVIDGQVLVPPTAAERKGIQPVVAVTANGGARAVVAVGEPVTFSAVVEVPPDAGRVVAAEWAFEGDGKFADVTKLTEPDAPGTRVTLKATHAFPKPGTYFPTLRASSQRQGDAKARFARIQNLGRVRVVVE
jgi:hypothetical protein